MRDDRKPDWLKQYELRAFEETEDSKALDEEVADRREAYWPVPVWAREDTAA